jgi:regulatory protein
MDDFSKALNYSFLLLKYRPRSKGEIKNRLRQKGYSVSLIGRVLSSLEGQGYLNDEEFTRVFTAAQLAKGYGRRKILMRLKGLEIPEDLSSLFLPDKKAYQNKLKELIEKKLKHCAKAGNNYQKILRYLAMRGFEYQEIINELDNLGIERFDSRLSE